VKEHCDWLATQTMPTTIPTVDVSEVGPSHGARTCRLSGCSDGLEEHKIFPSPAPSSVYPADVSTSVGTAIDSSSDAEMSESDHLDRAECTHTRESANVPEFRTTHHTEHRTLSKPGSNHANTYACHARALMEHYDLLGAPCGFWSRRNQSCYQVCNVHILLKPHPDTASNLAHEEDLD